MKDKALGRKISMLEEKIKELRVEFPDDQEGIKRLENQLREWKERNNDQVWEELEERYINIRQVDEDE